ncbi:unnamed protein product [Victoria cruziana]
MEPGEDLSQRESLEPKEGGGWGGKIIAEMEKRLDFPMVGWISEIPLYYPSGCFVCFLPFLPILPLFVRLISSPPGSPSASPENSGSWYPAVGRIPRRKGGRRKLVLSSFSAGRFHLFACARSRKSVRD